MVLRRIKVLVTETVARKNIIFAFGKAVSISVLNQAISSGTNFVLAIYLVRVLTTADFGLYGIGFAITLLYAGVGDALFLTQMVVHVPDKAPKDRVHYAARILVGLTLFCALTAVGAGVLLALSGSLSQFLQQYLGLGSSIVSASIAYLLKDFFVRHAYTARRESWALWVNVAVAISLVGMLLVQSLFINKLNSEGALWIYAVSNMVGVLVGFVLVRLPILTISLREIIKDAQEAWIGGRWALGGVAVTWSQTQAYVYVTALFVGPVGVGHANTAKILITPALFLAPAITQLVMPRLAALRATNQSKMVKICLRFSAGLVCFAVLYSVALIGVGDVLANILIGKYHHDEIAPLAAAWCLLMIFQFSRVGPVLLLQVVKEFRLLMLLNAISLVVAILISVLLMQIIEVQGAIIGSAIGELIFSILLYRLIMVKYLER